MKGDAAEESKDGIYTEELLGDLLDGTPGGVRAVQSTTWRSKELRRVQPVGGVLIATGVRAADPGRNVLRPYRGKKRRIRSGRGRIRVGKF
jgi:hypothetical protein